LDECDLKNGTSRDCNHNGIPDECDLSRVLDFPAATTYATENGPFSIPAGDLDRDGHLDLAVANRGSASVSVVINRGNGTFRTGVVYPVQISPHPLIMADLDGDGDLDLAAGNRSSASVSLLFNQGNGQLKAAVNVPAGDTPRGISAADLNKDGQLDLAV